MKSAFGNASPATLSRYLLSHTRYSSFLNPNPFPSPTPTPTPSLIYSPLHSKSLSQNGVVRKPTWCHTLSAAQTHALPIMDKEFQTFRQYLDESGSLRDRIKGVASEMDSTNRVINSLLLLVHQSRPITGNNTRSVPSHFTCPFYSLHVLTNTVNNTVVFYVLSGPTNFINLSRLFLLCNGKELECNYIYLFNNVFVRRYVSWLIKYIM